MAEITGSNDPGGRCLPAAYLPSAIGKGIPADDRALHVPVVGSSKACLGPVWATVNLAEPDERSISVDSPFGDNLDSQFLAFWLEGRARHTQRAYESDVRRFISSLGVALPHLSAADVQAFVTDLQPGTHAARARALSALRSMLSFGHRIGYLPRDLAVVVNLPRRKSPPADAVVADQDIRRMLVLEPSTRNRLLLQLLYLDGLRVNELCSLQWGHLEFGASGSMLRIGDGRSSRSITLHPDTASTLRDLPSPMEPGEPLLRSRKRGHLDPSQVLRIVRSAAGRAELLHSVSPRALRRARNTHQVVQIQHLAI